MEGLVVGSYRVVKKIGQGGMGAVYLGEHSLLGRRAAIKVLLPALSAHQDVVQRFFNEARAATAIDDAGIVQIFDFGYHTDGSAYIVMELLVGETLQDRVRAHGRLGPADTLRLLRPVATSLAAAHAAGIIHRDLKPENIFVVRDAEVIGGERTKVLDFGIAKLVADPQSKVKTSTTAIMGTPTFMSPEQCRGAGGVDARSDVYALGCVLFYLLTGTPPFDGDGVGDLIAAHLMTPAPAPSGRAPGIPPELDAVVARCLAKAPAERYQTMAELAAVLAQLQRDRPSAAAIGPAASGAMPTPLPTFGGTRFEAPATTLSAAAGSPAPTLGAPPRKGRAALIVGGAVAVAAAAVVAVIATSGSSTPTPQAAAPPPSPQLAAAAAAAVDAAPPPLDAAADPCAAGAWDACIVLGRADWKARDYPSAIARYQLGCDAGHSMSCTLLGQGYSLGRGVEQDAANAAVLYTTACKQGTLRACALLGGLYIAGKGVLKADRVRGVELMRQACDGDDAFGCEALAGVRFNDKQFRESFELYQRACDAGRAWSCGEVGMAYAYGGAGVKKDVGRGRAIIEKTCETEEEWCNEVGKLYFDGVGVDKNFDRAEIYFARGCNAGSGPGCSNLGMLYSRPGKLHDAAKAKDAYARACSVGFESACAKGGARDGE